jgi:curved DNA-binding protein CbpA
MTDPYAVLGVSRNASESELKKAYRELAKRYHPDMGTGAESSSVRYAKMQEINSAYDTIIEERRGGGSASDFTGSAGGSAPSGASRRGFGDVRNMILSGRIADADMLLTGVPQGERNGEWHFLKGTILYRKGWMSQAYTHFESANRMNPENKEYRDAFEHIRNQQNGNYGGYNTNKRSSGCGCSPCDMCCSLLCADKCCECCGGDLITCC